MSSSLPFATGSGIAPKTRFERSTIFFKKKRRNTSTSKVYKGRKMSTTWQTPYTDLDACVGKKRRGGGMREMLYCVFLLTYRRKKRVSSNFFRPRHPPFTVKCGRVFHLSYFFHLDWPAEFSNIEFWAFAWEARGVRLTLKFNGKKRKLQTRETFDTTCTWR